MGKGGGNQKTHNLSFKGLGQKTKKSGFLHDDFTIFVYEGSFPVDKKYSSASPWVKQIQ